MGLTQADLTELETYHREAKAALVGAHPRDAAVILARLFAHYPAANVAEGVNDLRMDDWLGDVADVPADILEAACAAWRRSKERFAPSPGQLLDKARTLIAFRVAYRERVEKVIARVMEMNPAAE